MSIAFIKISVSTSSQSNSIIVIVSFVQATTKFIISSSFVGFMINLLSLYHMLTAHTGPSNSTHAIRSDKLADMIAGT